MGLWCRRVFREINDATLGDLVHIVVVCLFGGSGAHLFAFVWAWGRGFFAPSTGFFAHRRIIATTCRNLDNVLICIPCTIRMSLLVKVRIERRIVHRLFHLLTLF